jgi:hypothetical protein
MANEKTLNDLSLKLQETNLRLEILADSGNKQETHLATLVKASKGDKLQDAEDKREAKKDGAISTTETYGSAAKSGKGGSLLMRGAMLSGIMGLLTAAFAGLAGLFTMGGLAALGLGLVKGGLLAGLVGVLATMAVRTITNYFGVTDIWDKAVDDLMAGKMSPGSMGLVGGGMAGAVAGFLVAGPLGAVAGAIIGSAIGSIAAHFVQDKFKLTDDEMYQLMANVAVGATAGAVIGGFIGSALGPLGTVAGAMLGAVIGALIGVGVFSVSKMIADRGGLAKIIDDQLDKLFDFVKNAFDGFVRLFSGYSMATAGTASFEEWKKMERGVGRGPKMKNEDRYKGDPDALNAAFLRYSDPGAEERADKAASEAARIEALKLTTKKVINASGETERMNAYDAELGLASGEFTAYGGLKGKGGLRGGGQGSTNVDVVNTKEGDTTTIITTAVATDQGPVRGGAFGNRQVSILNRN